MIKLPGATAAAVLCFASLTTQAHEAQEEMETVLVTGEQPGPGLWKVSRDDHVMWVLGSIDTVPKTIAWRTDELEARIAESQEVLYPGGTGVGIDIGMFTALTLVPAAFKAAKNPNGATLKDEFAPEDYATWLRLRQKYLDDDDDIEKYRPLVAEEKLNSAIEKRGVKGQKLTSIDGVVNWIAKKHKVRIHVLPVATRKIEVKKPRAILKAARDLDLAEGACVGRNLARIEKADARGWLVYDVAATNAWARGDLEVLRSRPAFDPELQAEDCFTVALDAANQRADAELPADMRRGLDIMKQVEDLQAEATAESERNWLAAAEAALANNSSTLAVLPLGEVMNPQGYLAKLEARGYAVEAPR